MRYRIQPGPNPNNLPDPAFTAQTIAAYLRVEPGYEEDLLAEFVRGAMDTVEQFCHQPIFQRAYVATGTGFFGGSLPLFTPVDNLSITYRPTVQEMPVELAATDFTYADSVVQFRHGLIVPGPIYEVSLSFVAGYDPDNLPASIRQAMRLLIGDWYERRTDGIRDKTSTVDRLLQPFVYTTP